MKIQKLINYEFNFINILFSILFFQIFLITFSYFVFKTGTFYINFTTIILLFLIFFVVLLSYKYTKNLYSSKFIYISILIFFIIFIYPRFLSILVIPSYIFFPYPLTILTTDINYFLLFLLVTLPFIFSASYFAERINKNLISKIKLRFNFLNFETNLKSLIILLVLSILIEFFFMFYLKMSPFSNIEVDKLHYLKMLLRNIINVDIFIFLVLGLILISNYKYKLSIYFLICFIYYIILALHFSKGGILRIDLIIIFQFLFLYEKTKFNSKIITTFFIINVILAPTVFVLNSKLRSLDIEPIEIYSKTKETFENDSFVPKTYSYNLSNLKKMEISEAKETFEKETFENDSFVTETYSYNLSNLKKMENNEAKENKPSITKKLLQTVNKIREINPYNYIYNSTIYKKYITCEHTSSGNFLEENNFKKLGEGSTDQILNFKITSNMKWEYFNKSLIDGKIQNTKLTLANNKKQPKGSYITFKSRNPQIFTGVQMIRQNKSPQNGGNKWKWQGSNDGTIYTDLLTKQKWGGEKYTRYTWCNKIPYKYIRFYNPDSFISNNSSYEYEWRFRTSTGTYLTIEELNYLKINILERKIKDTPKLTSVANILSEIFNRLGVVDYPILIISRIKNLQFQDNDNDFAFNSLTKRVINGVLPGAIFENHKLKEERFIGKVIMNYDKKSLSRPINYNTEPTTLWGSAYMYGNFYFGLVIIFFLIFISFIIFNFLKNINNKYANVSACLFLYVGIYGFFGNFGLDGHIIKLIIIGTQVCFFFLMLIVLNKFQSMLAIKKN